MIRKVWIKNFKCLREVSVELERFTVLVGANGSGKTSVLEAIHNAVRAATGDPCKVFAHERHADWVYTRGGTGDLSIRCQTEGGEFAIEVTPPEHAPRPEALQRQRWEFRRVPAQEPDFSAAVAPARKMVFLRLNAAVMAKPSYSDDDPPRVEYTGQGLGSALAYLALNDPPRFAELVAIARTLIPRLRRIRFRKEPVLKRERELVRFGSEAVSRTISRKYQGDSILFDFDHAENVSARSASEGTMLMLGLLTVLLGPARPHVVLLDDIEHGLHPLAQRQLVEVIGRVLDRFPELQLLATVYSPYLLNYLQPEQVRIMAIGPDGYSRCARLSEHPKFSNWKDEMAPGEMWSVFGEKWLAEREATL